MHYANRVDFTGQPIYIGMDVHKKSWTVSIFMEHLEHKTFTQPPEVETLVSYLRRHDGTAIPSGNIIPPDFNELGWKETVRMNPGQIIWVLMKFDVPRVPFKVPSSPRIDAYGMTPPGWIANEYVWHCHILEHEEHDMMRPLVVFSPAQKW